ncbi:WhiB family transcriptional regulator [Kitasatospora sp. NBC_01539]|uniref:WhiB family transcriptional regulator n=1 Tax=Kitasatospora sp. NBC_01539 TaxID=2903577 RepID=UPI0038603339
MNPVSRLPGAFEHHWNWQLHAACRTLDSSLFFHPSGERGRAHDGRERAAKQVCAGCPVREACLAHALHVKERYGVWGGLTEDERQELAGPARRAPRRRRMPVGR